MSKVINIGEHKEDKRKADLLEILDLLRQGIEDGEIEEFVAVSMDIDGEPQVHACVKDMVGAVGMFEIGKHVLISN